MFGFISRVYKGICHCQEILSGDISSVYLGLHQSKSSAIESNKSSEQIRVTCSEEGLTL